MEEAAEGDSAKMATTTNGNGNLVDEFEEAFQACLSVITKEEALAAMDKEDIKVEVDHTILRFIDLARQMEAFFLQKRFLLSALKPELIVKEDISELRTELLRKEELIKRHYEKITVWQNLLADLQSWAKSPAQGPAPSGLANGAPQAASASTQPGPSLQQQIQQQQLQQMQQQQQLQMQQQQMQQQAQQAMFMQRPGAMLQGPLAYLEKTTSNIGMPEGRR